MNISRTDAPREPGSGTCLVAVDGSGASVPALRWTLRHATQHNMRIEVLTVWPPHGSVLVHEVPGHFCAPRWGARSAQADVIRRALEEVPDRPIITTSLENGDTVNVIVHASARHDLVVLGLHSNDRPHRLTHRITEEALCEVVVVDEAGELSRRQSVSQPTARTRRATRQ